jgi:hypothetical protein
VKEYCGGVTWHCTWSTRRRINIAVPATCKLSLVVECHQLIMPSVNCTTIRTPSLPWVVPLHYLVRDAGTIKGYRVATISIDLQLSCRLCLWLPTDWSIILVVAICVIFYAIAMALSFPYLSSLHASSRFSIWFGIRFTIWHLIPRMIGCVYPYLTIHYEPSSTNCLTTASLPFSLTRQEPLQRRTRVEYLLFDTRHAGTSKRSNLEAWIQETWNLH